MVLIFKPIRHSRPKQKRLPTFVQPFLCFRIFLCYLLLIASIGFFLAILITGINEAIKATSKLEPTIKNNVIKYALYFNFFIIFSQNY